MLSGIRRSTALAVCLAVGVGLAATGCGDDSDSSFDSQFDNPYEKCRELHDAYCAFAEDCDGADFYVCLDEIEDLLDCDDVLYVSARYEECLDELRNGDFCPDPFALPRACEGALVTTE